jgi:hypothetical protein
MCKERNITDSKRTKILKILNSCIYSYLEGRGNTNVNENMFGADL